MPAKKDFEITLDWKTISEDGSPFYRFKMLDGKVVFWFSLHNNKNIYSIGLMTDGLFPTSGVQLCAITDMDKPFYFKKILINPHTLHGDITTTLKYIEELQLACIIGMKIEQFFMTEFLEKYVTTE